jgi:exopolyphosphatase/guanosine-5'-triphosphate,3'-diphosphate pyrophosphatase
MPTHYAVIDTGSNAIRFQLAAVEQPGSYRIVGQERRPVRLGHQVFETGMLDAQSRSEGLETLRKFKAMADRRGAVALRAVATSAMREAKDAGSFLQDAAGLGVPLEILPEEEEARLISLGILSGLKFDLPLGLFMDIGGGSVEVAVGNRTSTFCMFSLPLGAVRLTERFVEHDPPADREVSTLQRFVHQKLAPAVRRISHEKFTMAFGSGGTLTSLADTDARLTGEAHDETLYALRRSRLKSLFDLLRSQPLKERAALILDEPKRAEILVAGAAVLLTMMNEFDLDYVFVSRRGLRDGLMVDLLSEQFPQYTGAWTEEATRVESLEEIGEKYNYDKTHCKQVSRLALDLFNQLADLHGLPEKFSGLLNAAAILHDIGLFIGYPKHHKHSYYLIKSAAPAAFDQTELDIIANVARYHRKSHPSPKHLPFSQLSPFQQDVVRKLSALLRVADGLDYGHQSKVGSVKCKLNASKVMSIKAAGNADISQETGMAMEKSELMNEVFGVETVIE